MLYIQGILEKREGVISFVQICEVGDVWSILHKPQMVCPFCLTSVSCRSLVLDLVFDSISIIL